MPKSNNKRSTRKRRLPPDNSRVNSTTDCHIPKKQRTTNNINPKDRIAKSKQLTLKLQNCKKKCHISSSNNTDAKNCVNGKPRAKGGLEKLNSLLADSDDEDNTVSDHSDRCETPKYQPTHAAAEKLISPKTIVDLSIKLENIFTNPIELTKLTEKLSPPPVVPQKRPKRSGIPYIVGCKVCPRIETKPVVNFCKGSNDCGINENRSEEEDEHKTSKKRKRSTQKVNLSKSIFNAHSDEIPLMLKDNENNKSLGDVYIESDKTEMCGYNNFTSLSPKNKQRFSPLPSTSKNVEIFHKNDKLFNESLLFDELSDDNTHIVNCEILHNPCETVIDILPPNNTEDPNDKKDKQNSSKTTSIDKNEDYYSSIDITQRYNNDIIEFVDVDEIINESVAIINKYRKENELNTVTLVQSGGSNVNLKNVDPNCNTFNQPEISKVNIEIANSNSNIFVQPGTLDGNTDVVVSDIQPVISKVNTEIADPDRNPFVQPDTLETYPEVVILDSNTLVEPGTFEVKTIANDDCIIINDNEIFNNTRNRVIDICTINNTQENVILSIPKKKSNKMRSTDQTRQLSNNQNTIQKVITNFFNTNKNNYETVDLTTTDDIKQQDNSCYTSRYFFDTILKWVTSLSSTYFKSKKNNQRKSKMPTRRVKFLQNMSNHPRNHFYTGVEVESEVNGNNEISGMQNIRNCDHSEMAQSNSIPGNIVSSTTVNTNKQPSKQKQIPIVEQSKVQNSPPTMKSIGDCPICMDSLYNNTIASTICGHVFCMKCIGASIKTRGKKCPTCRKVLKGVGYHQLFL